MSDISTRRRWSGRLLIGSAVLALPLTGSISYAQDEVPPPPAAPAAPVAPMAPVAPAASVAPAAPAAPVAAPAPPARVVARDGQTRVIRIERRMNGGGDDARGGDKRVERRIIKRNGYEMTAEERAAFEKDMAGHRVDMAEFNQDMAEVQRELAENQGEIQREVRLAFAEAHKARPKVRVQCRDGQRDVAETVTTGDGETIFVCQAVAMDEARKALAMARAEIARSRDISAKSRAAALRSLNEAERRVRAEARAEARAD